MRRLAMLPMSQRERKVVFASSLGTAFEWYDFYLFGALAPIMSRHFFSGVSDSTAFIFALMAFAVGFAVRPLGGVLFGRLGDLVGRKHTFLVTILIMGLSTFIIGVLPSYATVGVAAPIILIGLRLLQGLALGGEYGGAATYVAEYAPNGRRGLYTAWVQAAAPFGLFLSLLAIVVTRSSMDEAAFEAWGWRVPFLGSMALLVVSIWMRMQLHESPVFEAMREEGRLSAAPVRDSFGQSGNLKLVLLALFGLTAGQGVVWYTGQFYALFFLTQTLKVDNDTAYGMMAIALLCAMPFYIFFGALSDRVGRKPIIMVGCLLAALTYFPLFQALTYYANPTLEEAQNTAPIVVSANYQECSFLFNPIESVRFTSSCDEAKSYLSKAGLSYSNQNVEVNGLASIQIGERVVMSFDGAASDAKWQRLRFQSEIQSALKQAGYPTKANPSTMNQPMVVIILFILMSYVTMVYGPIAAMLTEMFPTQIRYTSMSLPYHVGNGWFGGFLPTVSFAIVATSGNVYDGLWYPIGVALMTLVIGVLFVRGRRDVDIRRVD